MHKNIFIKTDLLVIIGKLFVNGYINIQLPYSEVLKINLLRMYPLLIYAK